VSEAVIELIVDNHPGVMSHVTGVFTRRAYNLERIVCGPIGDRRCSRVILVARESTRLPQLIADLRRLYDVVEIRQRAEWDAAAFECIDSIAASGRPVSATGQDACDGDR
jgi:acetolactate synthase-1/3 small subunit